MTDWRDKAACAKHPTEWWFAEGTSREAQLQRATAQRICQTCPALDDCAAWAQAHPEASRFGIWGGMSARTRLRMQGRPLKADELHTVPVTCGCGQVFYCRPSLIMKHCSGRCLDNSRARASRLAQQRMRDAVSPPDEQRLRNREAARRSRARKRAQLQAATEPNGDTATTEKPRVFPLVSHSPHAVELSEPLEGSA